MNDSERVAADYQQQVYDRLVHDMRPSTAPNGSSSGPVGGGIGNLSGWVLFVGMVGAVIGGILGRGLMGAIVGGFVFGGAIWALGAFARKSDGSVSRLSVVKSVLYGAAAGFGIAVVIALEYPDNFFNLCVNWMVIGSLVGGGYRLVRRARG